MVSLNNISCFCFQRHNTWAAGHWSDPTSLIAKFFFTSCECHSATTLELSVHSTEAMTAKTLPKLTSTRDLLFKVKPPKGRWSLRPSHRKQGTALKKKKKLRDILFSSDTKLS